MNKVMSIIGVIFLAWAAPYAQADSLYAYEYSTNYPHEIRRDDNDDNTYRSSKSLPPVYQQQQQLEIKSRLKRTFINKHAKIY